MTPCVFQTAVRDTIMAQRKRVRREDIAAMIDSRFSSWGQWRLPKPQREVQRGTRPPYTVSRLRLGFGAMTVERISVSPLKAPKRRRPASAKPLRPSYYSSDSNWFPKSSVAVAELVGKIASPADEKMVQYVHNSYKTRLVYEEAQKSNEKKEKLQGHIIFRSAEKKQKQSVSWPKRKTGMALRLYKPNGGYSLKPRPEQSVSTISLCAPVKHFTSSQKTKAMLPTALGFPKGALDEPLRVGNFHVPSGDKNIIIDRRKLRSIPARGIAIDVKLPMEEEHKDPVSPLETEDSKILPWSEDPQSSKQFFQPFTLFGVEVEINKRGHRSDDTQRKERVRMSESNLEEGVKEIKKYTNRPKSAGARTRKHSRRRTASVQLIHRRPSSAPRCRKLK